MEVHNMKQVFSCSDFLNDLWQNTPEVPDSLPGPASEEDGSTRLSQARSTDMLQLLGTPEEGESMPDAFGPINAVSTSQQDSAGGVNSLDCSFRG